MYDILLNVLFYYSAQMTRTPVQYPMIDLKNKYLALELLNHFSMNK